MPTYEYRCNKCEKTFERIARIDDPSLADPACPHCESRKVARVYSSFFAKTSRKS